VLHETRWRDEISTELDDTALERLFAAGIHRRAGTDVYRAAWSVAVGFGWAKCYAAEFTGLAHTLGTPLYTRECSLGSRRKASGADHRT
jgi:hypothetical protein